MGTKEKTVVRKELSYSIVGISMKVHSELGKGFLEKVYENALMLMFKKGRHRSSTASTFRRGIYE